VGQLVNLAILVAGLYLGGSAAVLRRQLACPAAPVRGRDHAQAGGVNCRAPAAGERGEPKGKSDGPWQRVCVFPV